MATKNNTKEKKTQKSRTKKEPEKKVDYSDFIKITEKEIMLKHIDHILEICRTYEGIEPAPLEEWKYLNSVVIEISKAQIEANELNTFRKPRLEPTKRAQYTLTNKVREMQTKRSILNLYEIMQQNPEVDYHFLHLISTHIAIWTSENAKVEKEKPKKEIEK